MKRYTFTASCATGLEVLVKREIEDFGGSEIEERSGSVSWEGPLVSGYRCCLWSRFASRVFLQLDQFTIGDEDALYEHCVAVRWHEVLNANATFAVNCTLSGKSPVTNNRYAALKVKDALVDNMRDRFGVRPSVRGDRPDIQLHLHIDTTTASLAVDLSGESLHRRGYRSSTGLAPLKETLAAALVALTGWPDDGGSFVDPMCGTGTLLIEAAMMFGDSAPGLSRNYYGFAGWLGHESELWQDLVAEAVAREEAAMNKSWPTIAGYDSDPAMVRAARQNIKMAGLEDYIHIQQMDLANLVVPRKTGLLLTNLPYGERLSETEVVSRLYRAFGRILKQRCGGWKTGVFISNPDLTDSFSLSWENKFKLFNGSIPCRLLLGTVPEEMEKGFVWYPQKPDSEMGAVDFINRFQKNLKKMLKWADREGVSCFRVYNRDLPDYNFTVDLYSKWVHIQEYAPPGTISPETASERLHLAIRGVKEVLGLRSDRLFIKTRERQRGKKQYEKKGNQKKMLEVQEGGCHFLVNFTDYLDTGLFLDHRPVRMRICREAAGKRFLNLYGYTGTATVHAAVGGAVSTMTVDSSATYLHWTRMNLALNGLDEIKNRVEKADCIDWLDNHSGMYDLIFIDPPTFSNTKKEGRVFDIQRDHFHLLELAMQRLAPDGLLIFSTNFRRFRLDDRLQQMFQLKNISAESVPYDYSRDSKIHMCWEIKRE